MMSGIYLNERVWSSLRWSGRVKPLTQANGGGRKGSPGTTVSACTKNPRGFGFCIFYPGCVTQLGESANITVCWRLFQVNFLAYLVSLLVCLMPEFLLAVADL